MRLSPISMMKSAASLLAWILFLSSLPCRLEGQLIPPEFASPTEAVNTNIPGFKARFSQCASRFPLTSLAAVETLLAGRAKDPSTGVPIPETAFPGPETGGFFFLSGALNWHERVKVNPDAAGGLFTAASTPPSPDQPLPPAIPGTAGSSDFFAMEATGFMELPAGNVRLGVNSDDGFRLSFGAGLNPLDPFSPQTSFSFNGTRTFGSTEATFTVAKSGLYPFRLVWFENNGTNAGLEFYSYPAGQSSGQAVLVNDSRSPQSLRVYRDLTEPGVHPMPVLAEPAPGSTNNLPEPLIRVDFVDGTAKFEQSLLVLDLDGTRLVPEVQNVRGRIQVSARAALLSPQTSHTATVVYGDTSGLLRSNSWKFSVGSYVVIPAEFAVPDVDFSRTGFKLRSYQMPHSRGPEILGVSGSSLPQVERALAGGYLDASTRLPYVSLGPTNGVGEDGYFSVPRTINLSQTAGGRQDVGNFRGSFFPSLPDEQIPGVTTNADHFVVEILTYINLRAGAHRFGVNSDEGFKLTVSRSAGDAFGLLLGQFNGGRTAADTLMDFVVERDGVYPFRLLWWDGTGNASCELFSVDPETGDRFLINDPSSPYLASQHARTIRPYTLRCLPSPGSALVFPTTEVLAEIRYGTLAMDPGSVRFEVNGRQEGGVRQGDNSIILFRPGSVASLLPQGTNTARVIFNYFEGGVTKAVTNQWSFNIGIPAGPQELGGGANPAGGPEPQPVPFAVIPPANRVPPGAIDFSKPGFKIVKLHQLDRSLDGVQTNGGRYPGAGGNGNRMPRPEIQLSDGYINRSTGQPFPNLANLAGFNADGSFDVGGVFDFSSFGVNAGVFNPTLPMPGIPGKGTSPTGPEAGSDNFVLEAITYMDLKAGSYLMSLNSDDGFVLSSAPGARDTLGTLVGYLNDSGGAAATPSRWFSFVVLADGIYPFRLVYWEGGSTASVEWMTIDPGSGQMVMLNDSRSVASIRTYREYLGPPRPWVRFSVYPMPARWDNLHQQSGPGRIPVVLGGGNSPEWGNGPTPGIRPFADGVGAVMADLGDGVVRMTLNGAEVPVTVTRSGGDSIVSYRPSLPLDSGSTNVAALIYAGVTNSWTFVVQNYSVLPDSLIQLGKIADVSAQGFRARVKKIKDGTAGVANTLQRAEDHLRGVLVLPDTAVPGPEPDGAYLIPGIINWNQEMRGGSGQEIGNLTSATGYPDEPIPGIGSGTTGEAPGANDLISAEVLTYLDLPKGYVKLGVNSDEGFRVTAATGYNTRALVLAATSNLKPASDVPFSLFVVRAGLYPIRILWLEATGSASLEFFSYGPNNERIPVNAPGNPNAIRAYHRLVSSTVPTISIEPGSTGIKINFEGRLQRSTNLSTPRWEDVPGAASPLIVNPAGAEAYFRTVRQ